MFISTSLFLILYITKVYCDMPCVPRAYPESIVCVCNATYCDTITREMVVNNTYFTYTSNAAGLRFQKSSGQLDEYVEICPDKRCSKSVTVLTINPKIKYQRIEGFGGAVTDAAAMNWQNLSDPRLKQHLINSYASESGIEYNMIRTPIGGCDFSTHAYAYNEKPADDVNLDNFDLSSEDYNYKIPMIKSLMNASTTDIHVIASTWSPPLWMKSRKSWSAFSRLKPEYYQTYALYHYKFIDKYANNGIQIWGITTTNEPVNGDILPTIQCLGWTANVMGRWIAQNLGPTIRNSTYRNVKILAVDDQRVTIPYFFNLMVKEHKECLQYIDGIAVHYYADFLTPATVLTLVSELYPDKFIISTEACEGTFPWQERVSLGSWKRAITYAHDIITDLNHQLVGWLDWNLCLDEHGGPNYENNYADSPIIVYNEKGEFVKQPMFYALGHFSKFIPRDSRRISVSEDKPLMQRLIENVAVITPNNTIVIVLHNSHNKERMVKVRLQNKEIVLNLSVYSITTIEMPYEMQQN